MKTKRPHAQKKNRPCAPTQGRQNRNNRHAQPVNPTFVVYHANRPASSQIEDFIPHGAENAVTTRELSRLTGLHPRRVTLAVETARKSGFLICSDSRSGYFLPVTRAEAQRCIRALRSRWKHQARTLAAMERALMKAENLLP